MMLSTFKYICAVLLLCKYSFTNQQLPIIHPLSVPSHIQPSYKECIVTIIRCECRRCRTKDTFFSAPFRNRYNDGKQWTIFAFPASHRTNRFISSDSISKIQINYLFCFCLSMLRNSFLWCLCVLLLGLSLWKWDSVKCSRAHTCRRNIYCV